MYKCRHLKTEKDYAVKMIPRSSLNSRRASMCFERELNALHEIDHVNVIRLHDCFRTKNYYYIVMDYCNGGDLGGYL